jgi:hypothetical protein
VPRPPIAPHKDHALVAIIDSGIARTPELQPALAAEFDMAARPARTPYDPRYDHGTMVATILLRHARVPVRIVSLRIDDPAGCPAGKVPPCQASAAPIVAAIRKATALHVDAINVSLALKDDPAIAAAVGDAAKQGIPVILAAGNDGLDRPGNLASARAGYPNAILVGALDASGHPWSGTNRPEPKPDGYVYAWQQGVEIPTLAVGGRQVVATGTSFAAPIETARQVEVHWRDEPEGGGGARHAAR